MIFDDFRYIQRDALLKRMVEKGYMESDDCEKIMTSNHYGYFPLHSENCTVIWTKEINGKELRAMLTEYRTDLMFDIQAILCKDIENFEKSLLPCFRAENPFLNVCCYACIPLKKICGSFQIDDNDQYEITVGRMERQDFRRKWTDKKITSYTKEKLLVYEEGRLTIIDQNNNYSPNLNGGSGWSAKYEEELIKDYKFNHFLKRLGNEGLKKQTLKDFYLATEELKKRT